MEEDVAALIFRFVAYFMSREEKSKDPDELSVFWLHLKESSLCVQGTFLSIVLPVVSINSVNGFQKSLHER